MPMNPRHRKGIKFQNWVAAWFRELGYDVHNKRPQGRYEKLKDIFGADILVMNGKEIRFIQCADHSNVLDRLKEFLAYKYPPPRSDL